MKEKLQAFAETKMDLEPKMEPEQLAKLAHLAKENSYSPYSKFRVGAALLSRSGVVYQGCNVENASYGGAICAERTAFVKAVSHGERDFSAIAIAGDVPGQFLAPCGICRQFMVEFGKELQVILTTPDLKMKSFSLKELLPMSFGPEDLPLV